MESSDKSKQINIKNCMCYYSDDIYKSQDFYLDDFDRWKIYTKIFWFITFHTKHLLDQKPLRIRIDNRHGSIRVYDGTRYLVSFDPKK